MADEPAPPADAGKNDPQGDKTFSQEQVDKIVQNRLEKEKGKYADYDQLKSASAELEKLREAGKSELEKAQAKLSELEQATTGKDGTIKELRVQNAVLSRASQLGITNPTAAVKLLDWSKVEYDDSGEPKNIDDVLKAVAEEFGGVVGQPRTTMDGGTRQPTSGDDVDTAIRRLAGRA